MQLFGIGDLHLSLGVPEKPMDIFQGWENYMELLEQNWRSVVQPEDTVVVAGDLSWGMNLQQAKADFAFLDALPGQKIILKGNHDYWWNSMKKMQQFFVDNGFSTLQILHNNHYAFAQYGICGTRGWVNMNGEEADAKVLAREVQRLEVSIQSALAAQLQPIVFLHYPPIYGNAYNYDLLEVLHRYQIADCYYGHIHGKSHQYAFQGQYEETKLHMISGDYIQFNPQKIV
jgi:predicted phosphohydrolase